MKIFPPLALTTLLILALTGCVQKRSGQLAEKSFPTAKTDSVSIGATVATGHTVSLVDKNGPIEIVIGSPYTSAIGEECFDAKAYRQDQGMPQSRAICRRNGVWTLLPEILMPTPAYSLSASPSQ